MHKYDGEYIVFDVESTLRGPDWNKGHPMWPDNRVVWAGSYHWTGIGTHGLYLRGPYVDREGNDVSYIPPYFSGFTVGHNLKFDLLYALKNKWITPKELFERGVWDTQVVEYILSAQTHTYPSLDECAVKYGGVVKDDRIKEMWDAGVATEAIPAEMIRDYLEGDLKNTNIVFIEQLAKVMAWGLLPLVNSQMNALIAITVMEYNGMHVDLPYLRDNAARLGVEIAELEKGLSDFVAPHLEIADIAGTWNWHSTKDVSLYLFGGTYTTREKELVGKYKNGKDKYKLMDKVHTVPSRILLSPEEYGATKNKLGYYTVDDTVLKNIGMHSTDLILKLRELSKQKETYYENLISMTFPSNHIHANINQAATKTGRLSCNKPNIQNQTGEGGIKKAYTSRFKEGILCEFDFNQLEVGGLALISGDEQLIKDINDGVDMHTELFKSMYGVSPSTGKRKVFKRLSFGLIYGAGPKTLAENAGCTIEEAKKFIRVFYDRYKGVAAYHVKVSREANDGKKLLKEHTKKGLPMHGYLSRTETGRMYLFKEYDNEWKGGVSFSPTELKNWRVQGFSTGDVVPHMLGVVVKYLCMYGHDKYVVPIMTVHDSIEFDVDRNFGNCLNVVGEIRSLLNSTSEEVSKHFSMDIDVNFTVGFGCGKTWGDMKEIA